MFFIKYTNVFLSDPPCFFTRSYNVFYEIHQDFLSDPPRFLYQSYQGFFFAASPIFNRYSTFFYLINKGFFFIRYIKDFCQIPQVIFICCSNDFDQIHQGFLFTAPIILNGFSNIFLSDQARIFIISTKHFYQIHQLLLI